MPARLVVYFPLADPAVPVDLLDAYVSAGVDVIECGWPAADPYLDGPDVRASMARAIRGDPAAALAEVRARLERSGGAKALLMTYAEPGHPGLDDAKLFAGLYGVLAVAPPDAPRRAAMERNARRAGAAVCGFLSLPPDPADVAAARAADGYVMLQAAAGLTGPRPTLDPANAERIAALKAQGVAAPIVLGFGVSDGAQARAAMGCGADGIVVGSAALRAAQAGRRQLAALLENLRRGLDG